MLYRVILHLLLSLYWAFYVGRRKLWYFIFMMGYVLVIRCEYEICFVVMAYQPNKIIILCPYGDEEFRGMDGFVLFCWNVH